jgi:hypothetical protein
MANYWTEPKKNWLTTDGIGYGDLNRIESNISANRDGNFRKVQGFGYEITNTVAGYDGLIGVTVGSCYSENGMPIRMNVNFAKNLNLWAPGNGGTFGGMASGVVITANTWYYIFVIMNPVNGRVDIMIDDNTSGSHFSNGTFTEKRFVNSFKTAAAGGNGSFDIVEMYSTGDRVFINPNSMYAARKCKQYVSGVNANKYELITLDSGGIEGFALPEIAVKANLNIGAYGCNAFGLISSYSNVFTVPTVFNVILDYTAEYLHKTSTIALHSVDLEIMIDASRQIYLARDSGSGAYVDIAIRGYLDERLLE